MQAGRLNRRAVLGSMAGSFMLATGRAGHADDIYSGQYISAEPLKRSLLGPEIPATATWQFRTAGKLPVLRAKQGQEIHIRVLNTLSEDLWLHFFGLRGPAEMSTILVAANGEQEVVFTPPDAGSFWFGPLLNASRHRDMGLYGLLIVDEAQGQPKLVDLPLILDDWMVDDKGQMDMSFGDLNTAIGEGRLGNWFTANGARKPTLTVSVPTRLRLLNACNARSLSLLFKNLDLILLAEDGQPLPPRALGSEAYHLHPGQRADVLIAKIASQGTLSINLEADEVEAAIFLGEGAPGDALPADFRLPENPLPPLGAGEPRSLPITIEGGAKGGLQSAMAGTEKLDLRHLLEKGLAWAMNGIAGPGGPLLFDAKKGETLLLTFDNRTNFPQPLHIHGHVWNLVEDNGVTVQGGGWRDTVLVKPLATAKLLMVADNPGPWAIQSLIAERADAGLLGGFTVSDMP